LSLINKFIGVICAAILLFPVIEFDAMHAHAYDYPTPEGYSDNDYQKLIRFYLNGNQHLKWDISDPMKWHGVRWDSSANKRVVAISLNNCQIRGDLDLSDFSNIIAIEVPDNDITHLNVNNCPKISAIICNNNQIKWIAGLDKIMPSAYVSATGNPNFTIVRSDIATDEIVDSFKSGEDSTFVLSEVITLDSDVFNSIPIGSSVNFTIVNADDRFLYEWSFSNILPSSYCSSFNLSADLTPLNSDSATMSSLTLAGSPPPFARLKIDVSKHYSDGELLYIYKYSNNHCNEESSYLHSLTNLASNVEVRNGIIDFAPTGSEIVLSNLPLEIKESTTPTTTTTSSTPTTTTTSSTSTISTETTAVTSHLISTTTVVSSKVDDSNMTTSSQFSAPSERQDEYTNPSIDNSNMDTIPVSSAISGDAKKTSIKEPNPSTYGRSSLLFFPFMVAIVFYLYLYNRNQEK